VISPTGAAGLARRSVVDFLGHFDVLRDVNYDQEDQVESVNLTLSVE
jgi:hypothetical protein